MGSGSSRGGRASISARRRSLKRVLEIRRGLAAARPDNLEWQRYLANTLHDVGVHAQSLNHGEEALGWYHQALELTKKLSEAHPGLSRLQDDVAALYNDMAIVFVSQRNGEPEAMRLYREALAIRGKLVQAHPTVSLMKRRLASQHYNIGLVLANRGRWDDAIDSFRRSRAVDLELTRTNPSVAIYRQDLAKDLFSLAYVSRRLGRLTESADAYKGARGAGSGCHARNLPTPSTANHSPTVWSDSARLLETEGKLDEALASHREAVEILRTLVQDRPHVVPFRDKLAACQFSLADCLAATGRLDLARQVQHEALATRLELVRSEPGVNAYKDLLANGYLAVARLEVNAGRSGEALRLLEQAGAIYDRLAFDRPSEFVARGNSPDFQLVLAAALEASGDLAGRCAATSSLASSPNGSPCATLRITSVWRASMPAKAHF